MNRLRSMLIEKIAKLNDDVTLYAHQQRVVDDPATSKVIAHAVGSGKTLTAIAKFEKMKADGKANKALVVVPSSLRDNFGHKGVKKFTDSTYNIIGNKQEQAGKQYSAPNPESQYNIVSYDIFKQDPEKLLRELNIDTVIADEAHRGKNEGVGVTQALKNSRRLYKNHLGLTGSLVSNSIADVQPLVDVATGGDHELGENKQKFTDKWLRRSAAPQYKGLPEKRKPVIGFKNAQRLRSELGKNVDYVDFDDIKEIAHMPNKDVELVKVPISREQAGVYKKILKDNPGVKKMIFNKRLETMKDEEAAKAFSMLIESRKLMNSVGSVSSKVSMKDSPNVSPKTKRLLDDLEAHLDKNDKGQAILLTHMVNGGVDVLEEGLKQRNIDYGEFIGKGNRGVTEETRQQAVGDYNSRKKRVMIVSSAGGEGISLGDTDWEGVLDPHYNPEKMKQMEARGIRSGGLRDRPKKDRVVKVNRYMATMPKTLGIFSSNIKTPDEFIYEIAENKERQNQLLFNLLKENNKKRGNKLKKTGDEVMYSSRLRKIAFDISESDRQILTSLGEKIPTYSDDIMRVLGYMVAPKDKPKDKEPEKVASIIDDVKNKVDEIKDKLPINNSVIGKAKNKLVKKLETGAENVVARLKGKALMDKTKDVEVAPASRLRQSVNKN